MCLISATEMFSRKHINACAEEKKNHCTDGTLLKSVSLGLKRHDKWCVCLGRQGCSNKHIAHG